MEYHLETSDASYDAKISLSNMPNHNWDNLEHKTIINLDPDYLNLLRLLPGQPMKHKPRFINERYTIQQQLDIIFGDDSSEGDLRGVETFSGTFEGQQSETRTINDFKKNDDEAMRERAADVGKRTERTEMLRDLVEGDKKGDKKKLGESDTGKHVAEAQNDIKRSKRKSLKASDRKKAVKLEKETRGQKRRFSELNEGKIIAQLENELEQIVRSSSEVDREGKENQVENAFERFKRDFNEIKRIKNKAVEIENSMKEKAKRLLLILNGSEVHPTATHIQGLGSQAVQVVKNNVEGTSKLCNSVDASLVQAENIIDNIKIEQGPYIPDSDVEVLDCVAIVEQGITSSFVPTKADLTDYTGSKNNTLVVTENAARIEFRRDLMDVLTKPFDKEEYDNLSKLFKEGLYRRSCPAVGRKLNRYRYKREKRMNILRGFFFWLKNITQEGSFCPWEDRQCLAI